MGKQGQCGVYKLYKLSKSTGNTFSNEFKKLERDSHVVTHEYVDLINHNSVINGSLYEYDEKADKLYWDKKPFKKTEDLSDGTDGIISKKTIEEADSEIKLENLRNEYATLSGKKPHHLMKEDKLIEEIEKLKN